MVARTAGCESRTLRSDWAGPNARNTRTARQTMMSSRHPVFENVSRFEAALRSMTMANPDHPWFMTCVKNRPMWVRCFAGRNRSTKPTARPLDTRIAARPMTWRTRTRRPASSHAKRTNAGRRGECGAEVLSEEGSNQRDERHREQTDRKRGSAPSRASGDEAREQDGSRGELRERLVSDPRDTDPDSGRVPERGVELEALPGERIDEVDADYQRQRTHDRTEGPAPPDEFTQGHERDGCDRHEHPECVRAAVGREMQRRGKVGDGRICEQGQGAQLQPASVAFCPGEQCDAGRDDDGECGVRAECRIKDLVAEQAVRVRLDQEARVGSRTIQWLARW